MTHILLIESEDSPRQTLKSILEQEGYEVTAVSAPTDAVSQYPNWRWDLVICDAIDASYRIAFMGIPILSVPTRAMLGQPTLAEWDDMNVLPKPFHRVDFVAAVRAQLALFGLKLD